MNQHLDSAALARAAVEAAGAAGGEGGERAEGGEKVAGVAGGGAEARHLAHCARCRGELEALRADLAELGRRSLAAAPRPSRTFAWPPARSRARAWRWAPAAGALAAALVLLVVWLGPGREQRPPVVAEPELLAEALELEAPEPEGFTEFLVAGGQAGQEDQDFLRFLSSEEGAEDDYGVEGVITWSGDS